MRRWRRTRWVSTSTVVRSHAPTLSLAPRSTLVRQIYTQQTYASHRWRLTSAHLGRPILLLAAPTGDSTVVLGPNLDDHRHHHRLIPHHVLHDTPVRGKIHGGAIVVTADPEVSDESIAACVECVSSIFDAMPETSRVVVLDAMRGVGVEIAVIGVRQATTDVAAHRHLKGKAVTVGPARTFDDGTRGLGATVACPVMSVGEENLLPGRLVDPKYPDESILVHELAHTVMNLGLRETSWYQDIKDAYAAARRSNAYDLTSYCMQNADEYWAEMTQAWFRATRRRDVTSGVTSREELIGRDPRLAAIMVGVYGDASPAWTWRASDGGRRGGKGGKGGRGGSRSIRRTRRLLCSMM